MATAASGGRGYCRRMVADWSALPRQIVHALDRRKTLDELAAELHVTDARVRWYLDRLQAADLLGEQDGKWSRTDQSNVMLTSPEPATDDQSIMPGRTVYDFQQAYADAAAGMFGTEFVQQSGEHGARISLQQAAEFRDRLLALIAEYFAPGKGDRTGTKYGFHWVLTPTDLHPIKVDPPE